MTTDCIADSRFWKSLWEAYKKAPSIALCRVPELEYAATLSLSGTTLDHCCGDGIFASLAWPQERFTAGCDLNEVALNAARRLGRHNRIDACDVSKVLPYETNSFNLVFDNSAIEHVLDLDGNLKEISRVLKPGGRFAFNVLNHRYFDWWPLDRDSMEAYREWQPFYHALTLSEWTERLAKAGFEIEQLQGYFNEQASRDLALLDCEFSGHFIRKRPSDLVQKYNSRFSREPRRWRERLGALTWKTDPDEGAGFFFIARRQ